MGHYLGSWGRVNRVSIVVIIRVMIKFRIGVRRVGLG